MSRPARGERADPPVLPPSLAPVTRVIVEQAKLDVSSFRLRLDHDQLGGMDISFSRGPKGLVVEISASSADTRHLLTGHATILANEIRATGVDLQNITIAAGVGHEPLGGGQGGQEADPRPDPRFGPAAPSIDAAAMAVEPRRRGGDRGGSSLDLLA